MRSRNMSYEWSLECNFRIGFIRLQTSIKYILISIRMKTINIIRHVDLSYDFLLVLTAIDQENRQFDLGQIF